MVNEHSVCKVTARRKTRDQNPCELEVSYTDDGEVLLRTIDQGGDVPLVALIDRRTALELARGLIASIEATMT